MGPSLIVCPHCARLHQRVLLKPGAVASCVRCGHELYRHSRLSLSSWLALTWGALAVFCLANYFPVAYLSMQGLSLSASLPAALYITWQQGAWFVAVTAALFTFAFPLGQILFAMWALQCIRRRRLPHDFRYGLRVLQGLSHWSMVPVLLLGIVVAMVKLADMAVLRLGEGLWAFGVLSVLLTMLSRLSASRLWRMTEDAGLVPRSGQAVDFDKPLAGCTACGFVQNMPDSGVCRCARCKATFHFRKPRVEHRVWALLLTAAILYIPANVWPVMTLRLPTGSSSHTILGGVIELWGYGSWDLALIVFIASVVVPLSKLLALSILMLSRHWRGDRVQRQRTRMYELVEFVGQWSMLDVFVVLLLSAMVDFPGMSQVRAEPGAAFFGMVVVLTMFAAMSYDPRKGWDAADPQPAVKRPVVY
ncbi:paraquat-inducible membrane protein A [Pusillimonas sp. T2]|uniref:paraquat-inducible protein A n=1 Tax=Pusillimonas sp. T2 TaxID=1548123 RepID=UPI000B9CD2BD|nr:paraquat-inducible protein A [Pusillimonas sp. T2]OXR48441.1 paraquat-inducible membrane protein A [Pusillimonas sp. T2]